MAASVQFDRKRNSGSYLDGLIVGQGASEASSLTYLNYEANIRPKLIGSSFRVHASKVTTV